MNALFPPWLPQRILCDSSVTNSIIKVADLLWLSGTAEGGHIGQPCYNNTNISITQSTDAVRDLGSVNIVKSKFPFKIQDRASL